MNSKFIRLLIAGVVIAFVGSSVTVQAAQITGHIGFAGSYSPNTTPLSAATSVTFPVGGQAVTPGSQFGSYSTVPNGTPVTFNGFTFSPTSPPVDPLWVFTIGSTSCSFDATTMSAAYNRTQNNWNIGGTGTAYITGLDPTPAVWNLTLSNVGESFSFAAVSGVQPVPEPEVWALCSLGLIALFVARRQNKASQDRA